MPFRRIALVVAFVVLSVTAVVWWRQRVAPAAQSGAEKNMAAMASDATPAAPTRGTGAATVAQAEGPAPVMLGGAGLRLADIPVGTPLRESLERLAPEVQQRALARLAERPFPVEDAQSMRVGRSGMPFYVCADPGVAEVARASAEAAAMAGAASEVAAGAVAIAAPPIRHSRPGSTHVIYLDFNGHTVTGTDWNDDFGVSSYVCRPYDSDGNATTFSESEQAAILSIWERVAEDYSPFDVDVTTEEPASWTTTTLRALITYTNDASGRALPYSSSATGVAYVGIFGESNCLQRSPAFIFYNNLSSAGNIAEVVAHEIGHNFGLHHDGGPSSTGAISEYYRGHGTGDLSWGPIMGASFSRNVSQWSRGEYYYATNTENDMAILAGGLGYRTDEAGDTVATATALTLVDGQVSTSGVIAHSAEADVYSFEACGPVALTGTPYRSATGSYGTNLDAKLELLDARGTVLAANDPEGPLAATIRATVPQGTYYVRLTPVGTGSPKSSTPTGYTAYGSSGQYTLTGSVFCRAPEFGALPAVQATLGDALDLPLALTGANSCNVSGLPAGLSFDPATQHIAGRAAALGAFDVKLDASNKWGAASASFTLTVVDGAPRIVSTSATRTAVAAGGSVALESELFAAQTGVRCQWYHNGRPIQGATSATWTTSSATRADAGWYYLRATNSLGTTQSPTFFVLVTPTQPRLVGWTTAGARLDAALLTGAGSVAAVAVDADSYAMALRADGSVAGWNWSDASVSTLAASGVVQLAAPATVRETPTLALLADGTVTTLRSPAGYTSGKPDALAGVVALATCDAYALALKADGTVAGWQASYQTARTELAAFSVPAGLADVVSIAVGNGSHALAARADGTVVAWCQSGNAYGEATVPAGLAGVVQVAATSHSSLALRTDGTVVAWGLGQSSVPAGLSGVVAIGAAGDRFFALKADGTGVAWSPDSSTPVAWAGAWCNLTALAGNGTAFLGVRDGATDVAASFTQSPASATVVERRPAVFSVAAGGSPAPGYVWQRQPAGTGGWQTLTDDAVYEGTRTATLRIRRTSLAMRGDRFRCVADNTISTAAISDVATLSVTALPQITAQPERRRVLAPGAPLTLSVTAAGTGTLSYQWYCNNQPISGATGPTLTVPDFRLANIGCYRVLVTDGVGSLFSPGYFVFCQTGARAEVWGGAAVAGVSAPSSLADAVALAVSPSHALALRADGTVTAWGENLQGQCTVPAEVSGIVAVVAAEGRSLALGAGGEVHAWGASSSVPAGLVEVVALAASASTVCALRADGTVTTWGDYADATPAELSDVVAIAVGGRLVYAVRADGSVTGWDAADGTLLALPSGLAGVATISACGSHVVALKIDGSVVEVEVSPTASSLLATPAGLSAPHLVAAGATHALALSPEGVLTGWGGAGAEASASGRLYVFSVAAAEQVSAVLRDASPGLTVSASPVSATVYGTGSVVFEVTAAGPMTLRYRWQMRTAGGAWADVPESAACRGTQTSALHVQVSDVSLAGAEFRCALSDGVTVVYSGAATLKVVGSSLIALSARSQAGAGDATLIMGFAFAGAGEKPTLVRGVGPGLPADVGARLADPQVNLFALRTGSWERVATNDNWGGTSELTTAFAQLGCGPLSSGSADAAILATLADNVYTAHVSGAGGTTGVALAEVYDAVVSDKARRLAALSVRNQVGTDAEILIAGFVITGTTPLKVIVRGVGPALAGAVSGYLADPFLCVYKYDTPDSGWMITGENDNWDGRAETSASFASVGMSALAAGSKDAALVLTLEPGVYTAQLSGVGGTTGVGLVEIYELP